MMGGANTPLGCTSQGCVVYVKSMSYTVPPHAKKVFVGLKHTVWQWPQTLFDGTTTTFERVTRPDYAGVIAVLDGQKILLVQDEQPDRGPVLTGAGGSVESNETPAEAAARELEEETGYRSGKLIPWFTYTPGSRGQWEVHIFVARDLTKIGEPQLEAGERITLKTYTFDEFLALGHNPQLRDLMLRIHLLEALLDDKKKQALQTLLYG